MRLDLHSRSRHTESMTNRIVPYALITIGYAIGASYLAYRLGMLLPYLTILGILTLAAATAIAIIEYRLGPLTPCPNKTLTSSDGYSDESLQTRNGVSSNSATPGMKVPSTRTVTQ